MKPPACRLIALALPLAFGLCFGFTTRGGRGADKEDDEAKAARDGVLRLTDALEKKDAAAAKKQVADLANKVGEVENVMALFGPRKGDKGGLGVGPTAGAIKPDGIEKKLEVLGDNAPTAEALAKEAGALTRMAYNAAAIALLAEAVPNAKGKAARKTWEGYAQDTYAASLQLAEAVGAKDAGNVKTTAMRVGLGCTACHEKFRD
jgi:hypothetical protein